MVGTDTLMELCVIHSSPDSDDTFPGEEPEEEFSMRDDQFLVSDRSENKFYGTLHGGSTGGSGVAGAVGPSLGYIGRRLQVSHLCATQASRIKHSGIQYRSNVMS